VKAVLGSVVFLLSLFLLRQILVGTGLLSPNLTLLFLVGLVGVPLGGIVFLEAAFEHEHRALRQEIRKLEEELDRLRRGDSAES
jgi:hypothetical protein